MSKVAVVYWSGTGNTEAMANAVVSGAQNAGAEADLIAATDFTSDQVASYDAIAFGCPAMGAEVLEESEFDPMFTGTHYKKKRQEIISGLGKLILSRTILGS